MEIRTSMRLALLVLAAIALPAGAAESLQTERFVISAASGEPIGYASMPPVVLLNGALRVQVIQVHQYANVTPRGPVAPAGAP